MWRPTRVAAHVRYGGIDGGQDTIYVPVHHQRRVHRNGLHFKRVPVSGVCVIETGDVCRQALLDDVVGIRDSGETGAGIQIRRNGSTTERRGRSGRGCRGGILGATVSRHCRKNAT